MSSWRSESESTLACCYPLQSIRRIRPTASALAHVASSQTVKRPRLGSQRQRPQCLKPTCRVVGSWLRRVVDRKRSASEDAGFSDPTGADGAVVHVEINQQMEIERAACWLIRSKRCMASQHFVAAWLRIILPTPLWHARFRPALWL